ncbi:mediator of RNA polymerase II transcription subunit 15-like [Rhea pennata]|uniref:mediator of RNA polymerase II transcription subunit 15-like n=1 Tax=Rhea pennata TaxID=8795 RepID=UPI002E2534B7
MGLQSLNRALFPHDPTIGKRRREGAAQLQLQQIAQQQQQQQFQQQQVALQQQQQQHFQAQQSAMQQQFRVQQQQAAAAAAAQQQQQQQQQLQAVQQQQQHMLKLQMQQQQNQQQIQKQQQQQQLQRIARTQQQQQQIPQQQIQQQPPQQVTDQQMQQMQQQQQQQQVAQAQQSQLPPQSQPQLQPMVSQAQAISGQIPSQVMPVTLTPQQLKAMQVRAQLVQQQQAAAVQAAQAQAAQMGAAGQMITAPMARAGMQIRPRFPPTTAVSATPPSSIPLGRQQMSQVSQNNITMMSSPSPVQQAQTPQSMPPPPQPQPSPQPGQPTSQPNSNAGSGPAPSSSSDGVPSPSPQPSQSPAAVQTPQNFRVQSPGPLNTPGNPNSLMSPASSSQSDEQQYLEKLKQLSKYIEPLRRMINKIDKNEDRKEDLSKMKSLLDILTDPSKRCPLKATQKCEIALEKLKNDMAVPIPPPPPVPPTKQQYLCQLLLDAVLANIRSPVFNHSLYRTFMPAMTAIHGPPITAPVASPRKRKYEEDEGQTIPNVLQGEVARLNPRFLVNLDPSHCSNNGTVHLICKLDDKNLPNVPPLQLSVPADYPDQSPLWIKNPRQYAANPFLQSVYRYMTSKLLQLPDKHSVTALLNTWAQSIRQACLSAA